MVHTEAREGTAVVRFWNAWCFICDSLPSFMVSGSGGHSMSCHFLSLRCFEGRQPGGVQEAWDQMLTDEELLSGFMDVR